MVWDLKGVIAVIKGIVTFIPGITKFIQKTSGATIGSTSARYCYSVWLRHLIIANKNGFILSTSFDKIILPETPYFINELCNISSNLTSSA